MRRRGGSPSEPLTAVCNHPTRRPAKGSRRVKVIRGLNYRRPGRAVDLPLPACDSNDRLTLSAFWLPILMPDGHVVAMKDAEFQWLALERSAIGGLRGEPPARLAVDGRRQADPVGQSGRRPPVRRGQCRSPCRKNLRAGRPAPAADRAARRPVARERRHPAGALAGIWRGARHACDLRRFAVRLSRWQPRRSDRRRQHRADRAATGAGAARRRDAASNHIIRARLIRAGLIRAESCSRARPPCPSSSNRSRRNRLPIDQQPAPSGEAPAGFALFDAFAEPAAADEPPAAETIPPAPKPSRARHHLPSKRLPASRCRRRAACRCASPGRWIAKAASRSAPTNSQA